MMQPNATITHPKSMKITCGDCVRLIPKNPKGKNVANDDPINNVFDVSIGLSYF